MPSLPNVSTFAEASGDGGFEHVSWHALFAPPGTPAAVVDTLQKHMARIVSTPEFTKRVLTLGLIPFSEPSTDGMRRYIQAEQVKWGTLIRKLGLEGLQ